MHIPRLSGQIRIGDMLLTTSGHPEKPALGDVTGAGPHPSAACVVSVGSIGESRGGVDEAYIPLTLGRYDVLGNEPIP